MSLLEQKIVCFLWFILLFKNEVMSLMHAKACVILPASLETVWQQ